MAMIRTEALTKTYSRSRFVPGRMRWVKDHVLAVNGLDLAVEEGEVFGFLGPNGAGKSTTIRMLTGITRPTSGKVTIDGMDMVRDGAAARFRVGYMPERPGFDPGMKAPDVLHYYGAFYGMGKADREARMEELFGFLDLGDALDRPVGEFSFGMTKRLALAHALMHDPPVLILDEPTGALDPAGKEAFRKAVRRLNRKGKTVFLSSHIIPELQRMAGRVCIISRGEMVATDTVKNLARKVNVESAVTVTVSCAGVSARVLKLLRSEEDCRGAKRVPEGLRLRWRESDNAFNDVQRALLNAGVKIRGISMSEPDLEELFFALTGKEGGGAKDGKGKGMKKRGGGGAR